MSQKELGTRAGKCSLDDDDNSSRAGKGGIEKETPPYLGFETFAPVRAVKSSRVRISLALAPQENQPFMGVLLKKPKATTRALNSPLNFF